MFDTVQSYNDLQGSSDLHVIFSGREHCSPYHKFSGRRNHFLIHYVCEGEGSLKINSHEYMLHKGDAFFIFPDQKNFYRASKENPWYYKWIGFKGERAAEILDMIGIDWDRPVYRGDYSPSINEILDDVLRTIEEHPEGYRLKIQSLFYSLLVLLLENRKNAPSPADRVIDYAEVTRAFIHEHYQQHNLSVNQIAEFMGLNRSYATTLFKRKTGLSIQSYLIRYRMERAIRLLLHTNYSISEIAGSVGYMDYYSFLKNFKKSTGVSPGAYRKENALPVPKAFEDE